MCTFGYLSANLFAADACDAEELDGHPVLVLKDEAHRVGEAIAKIEERHGKETIDQQCWKDHAAGTRAHDATTILEWLEDHVEAWTIFNKFLDRLVTKKWIEYHLMNPAHAEEMEMVTEDANKEKVMKKYPAYSLVHKDWSMSPLNHSHPCEHATVVQRYRHPARPVHGTEMASRPQDGNPVPWTYTPRVHARPPPGVSLPKRMQHDPLRWSLCKVGHPTRGRRRSPTVCTHLGFTYVHENRQSVNSEHAPVCHCCCPPPGVNA